MTETKIADQQVWLLEGLCLRFGLDPSAVYDWFTEPVKDGIRVTFYILGGDTEEHLISGEDMATLACDAA